MKKIIYLLLLTLVFSNAAMSQNDKKEEKKSYQFTKVKENSVTPVGDQYRSGTCWSFSAIGLVEAEVVRAKNKLYNLSEMWIVRNAYMEKAERYIRMHGNATFAAGGAFQDIPLMIKKYGIVPEEVYPGLHYGSNKHDHSEIDKVLEGFVKPLAQSKKLSSSWKTAFNAILDSYFGKMPEKFTYEGKEYTPTTFAASLGLNWDDYIEIGSFTHHPFYEKFIIEIPDNWTNGEIYNVKLDEMIQIMDDAINAGYCIGWGSDVSEKGFSWKNGVAIVPDEEKTDLTGSERDKWEKLTAAEKAQSAYAYDGTAKEKTITQEMRQEGFDNFETTDDHGMLIVGIYKDQNGHKFYKVKNSWNVENIYEGYFYASESFVRYKTIDIQINKNALTPAMKSKLGVK